MRDDRLIRFELMPLMCLFLMVSCVQKTKEQTVEFNVDTKGIEGVESIGVRGSIPPLNWNTDYELSDEDGDSIYTGRITFDIPYDHVELKFTKNIEMFELKDQPNRRLYFDEDQHTIVNSKFDVAD